ncbi:MAG: arginine--tRNA ligase [Phycisphaerae bacterium]|nr:arginine--tRNA ligase [Phycisphaerae bacterium]
MKPVIDVLEQRISRVLSSVTEQPDAAALVKTATDPRFGDYQVNGVMAAAKRLKTNPRQLAEKVIEELDLSDICQTPEIAGPGFINLRLKPEYLAEKLLEINADTTHVGIDKTGGPKRMVVDFSCPNIAKQMHVGHLRSTILGDALCRILQFEGHTVIRQNHIGDWGTQFGMLIAYLKQTSPEIIERPDSVHIADLEQFYRNAKARCDADRDFAALSRQEVVNLHEGNPETLNIWRHIVDESREHYQPVYDTLEVNLNQDNERGESFYADRLAGLVEELKGKGLAVESDGAMCVFPEGFVSKEGQPLPFIVQKSDGAFLYATTDLAALKFRIDELKADHIVYVTDARQKLHFEMLFATARLAGWVPEHVALAHVTFGTVLGEDNRPLKTRSGENIKLRDLLNEAVQRARTVVEEKNPQLDEDRKTDIARAVGIGAVKYADYCNNRTSDYVFSFDKMLAMDGNTAPYMQYAYARVKSIERKAAGKDVDIQSELSGIATLNLTEPAELDLARHLIRYGEVIANAMADYRPNYLTTFLYELAQKFSGFYNACPVLDANAQSRPTRLLLCDLTARTIAHGLGELLGIRVVEQM